MESTRISNDCFHVALQVFLNPVYISHHFHGSVKYNKKGNHDKKRVTPDEKTYRLKRMVKEVRFPKIIIIAMYPRQDEIMIMPDALTKKMMAIIWTDLE